MEKEVETWKSNNPDFLFCSDLDIFDFFFFFSWVNCFFPTLLAGAAMYYRSFGMRTDNIWGPNIVGTSVQQSWKTYNSNI